MTVKKIAIGCDHAGFPYKDAIVRLLKKRGIEVIDFGTNSPDSVDYPDFAHPVANAVESHEADLGIVLCGSGNGVAMTANKHAGIRAALCWKVEIARLARQHNDANVLAIPARFVSKRMALNMVKAFLDTDFEGGRHARRVQKMACC
ncbi:MAG: ribose 5-phosphate isomerase B [Bacteroidetes bacterium]|nr:MAG: ribose 5-phosphate isomerase B [Bacteroidota bacterium]